MAREEAHAESKRVLEEAHEELKAAHNETCSELRAAVKRLDHRVEQAQQEKHELYQTITIAVENSSKVMENLTAAINEVVIVRRGNENEERG